MTAKRLRQGVKETLNINVVGNSVFVWQHCNKLEREILEAGYFGWLTVRSKQPCFTAVCKTRIVLSKMVQ